MQLTPDLSRRYTSDDGITAREAQRLAHLISFGPVVFQTARIMLRSGILEAIGNSDSGMTIGEVAESTGLSEYSARCLLEASLSIGLLIVDENTDRFSISKTGIFLLTDPAINVNIDFNQDVNYLGWFRLEEALKENRPAGLSFISDASTVYEGLSALDPKVQKSWLGFDHFYSDNSFDKALEIVFARRPRTLLDVGGNTGKWALKCVEYDPDVEVTIADLPGQVGMMMKNVESRDGASRISGIGVDLLDAASQFPEGAHYDVVWMSQFLDCFSASQVVEILRKAKSVMDDGSRLYIMETLWNRQRFETSAMCLTLTSLYFTAIANGNSKMFYSEDLFDYIRQAGLDVVDVTDGIGWGHSIIECRKA